MIPSFRGLRAPSLALLVLASLLAASCAAKGEAAASGKAAPRVAVIADATILAGIPKLPAGAEAHGLPSGKDAEAALAALVADLAGDSTVAGIVVWPAPESLGSAFRKARDARSDLLLYAGGSSGDSLILESAADLVIDPATEPAVVPSLVAAMAELARRAASGPAERGHMGEYLACLRAMSPGQAWSAAYESDPETGVKSRNHILVSSTKR
jgi:hypothetical protein